MRDPKTTPAASVWYCPDCGAVSPVEASCPRCPGACSFYGPAPTVAASESRWLKFTLAVADYHADVNEREIVLHADGRSYDQRDDRAYQTAILVPLVDARRVAALLIDSADEAETRGVNRG